MGVGDAVGVADSVAEAVAEAVGVGEVELWFGPGDAVVEHPSRPRQVSTVSILRITMTTPEGAYRFKCAPELGGGSRSEGPAMR